MIGQTLSHYKIISKLGQGGMGEVYLAEDSRLDRKVALKILPQHLSERAELRERFEREARAVSSLNHPHICTLHDIGEQDGIHYLVMEHLAGETLEARLAKGALPLEQTLEYAIQIADALDKAHRQGVVHRDLKPGNIMLVKSGAKLLDFGLAKLQAADTPTNLSALPTEQANLTAEGTILGTLQYMAPEQLEGKEADSRTDIFAFGAVVYEMATGKKAFEGKSQASLIAAIMKDDPPAMSELQPMTPSTLDHVVRRCMSKVPEGRWQAASDVMAELRWVTEVGTSADSLPSVTAPAAWRRAIPWGIAATTVVAAVVVVATVMSWSDSPVQSPGSTTPQRLTIDLAEGVTLPKGQGEAISISPDGQTLVYVGESASGWQLYRRDMNQFTSTPIPGTEGALRPAISPDGTAVVFWEADSQGLQRVSLAGGDPFPVCRTCMGGFWSDDGHIYFRRGGLVSKVSELGGQEESVPIPDRGKRALINLSILPGGKGLLFEPGQLGEFAGVSVLDFESEEVIEVSPYGSSPIYSPTGHILFSRGNTLFALPFDVDQLEAAGPEVAVLQGVRVENGGSLQVDVSNDGLLVYAPADGAVGTELVWVSRQGAILEPVYGERRVFYGPRISPDGQQVAVQIKEGTRSDIWILDIGAGTLRLLAVPTDATSPLWANDGEKVAFGSGSPEAYLIQWAPADGSGEVETLIQSNYPIVPEAFSGDGTHLIFREDSPNPSLFVAELAEEGSRIPFLATEASEGSATLSHNGRWLAYDSDSSGVNEVYVRPFPGPGGQTLISTSGGSTAIWGPDDTELFYWSADDAQMRVVSLQMEPFLVLGEAPLLDTVRFWNVAYRAHYDVHPDGQRFLMLAESENESRPRINVILNWDEELKRLVPTDN